MLTKDVGGGGSRQIREGITVEGDKGRRVKLEHERLKPQLNAIPPLSAMVWPVM